MYYFKDTLNKPHALENLAYAHLLPEGCVGITAEEADSLTLKPVPPTPLDQIRTLERQYADTQAKVTRQALLALALDKAMTYPEAEGLTREEVHNYLMAQDNGYRALFNLEQQVDTLRAKL